MTNAFLTLIALTLTLASISPDQAQAKSNCPLAGGNRPTIEDEVQAQILIPCTTAELEANLAEIESEAESYAPGIKERREMFSNGRATSTHEPRKRSRLVSSGK